MESLNTTETVTRQVQQWEAWEKHSKQQLKLWRELGDLLERSDLSRSQKVLAQLESSQAPDLPDVRADAIKAWCQQEERQRPLRFSKQLRDAAEQQGLPCQTLGASPPTLRLEPLNVELDFKKGEAILSYARLELGRTTLDADLILRERARLLASLDSGDFQPEDFLAKTYEAYRRCLTGHGLKLGERVDLVDLLPELAFLLQSDRFRKDPTREAFRPYGKVRFAYDLARLRRSRVLEHQGARLTLGTATLGSTRSKDRVMFLEEAAQGQYYLSIAFQGGPSR
ncbi:hypothetical protein IV102_32735 [bacterium]|nr:hypothetical protein [bacterium]